MNHDAVLKQLAKKPVENVRALQELRDFADRCRIFAVHEDDADRFAYLLISGHPSVSPERPTVILGGNPAGGRALAAHLPKVPFLILQLALAELEVFTCAN